MVFNAIFGGAMAMATGLLDGNSSTKIESDQSLIDKEESRQHITAKELEATIARHGSLGQLFHKLANSLSDRELRKDFFLFLRAFLVDQWIDTFKENGRFMYPDEQGDSWLNPIEWSEFPEFYDIAIQPRLSADTLDISFILNLKGRYPGADYETLFGGILSIYVIIFATLETDAGKRVFLEYGGMPDVGDQRYYEIKRRVHEELGLQKSFKEILEKIDGDPYSRIDDLASNFQ